ncbi:glycoside hydrolase family 19 protein [Laribacter hongkongensis]|uniref:glycoside hydrolase family 19 protein n=1 Tax=Laribacter hongkongensis TaxID=168471 RepID=UPI001EFD4B9D|nr:glycoside hydrolase family 19 protein [Laribacter hongkongensis]MCG8990895.1 glycoside hydrolase family 19 protein [Laribacter hongkongensis]MCG8997037.1 glycoside hydrolase family 19 protein [Laribacter hongkongensis]MCG9001859.1 glycoside hydrolase family 19 protein [Laribacter hongkongensis]MCG9003528.1 glycoside hydrolase family 19 protein [Laribacter hongkongensis]MCG9008171.1 glycoside hydrolase family 19 protein [Laribacter hongkongensis]
MARYGITSPTRQRAFLAQIGHESGQLRYTREIWGPTPAQLRYEGRSDIGNIDPGDGRRFLGRGLIQITGRSNYRTCSQALYDDDRLLTSPALLEQPEAACLSAAWFWYERGLNALADRGDFATITRRINGGLNGQVDRLALFQRAQWVIA